MWPITLAGSFLFSPRSYLKEKMPITNKMLQGFKLNSEDTHYKETAEEIINGVPLIIQAMVPKAVTFNLDTEQVHFKKKTVLVMSMGMYDKLQFDKNGNRLLKPMNKSVPFHKYRGENLTNKNLLVMRSGGFGDLLFLQPLIKFLKQRHPLCKIILAGGCRFIRIIENWPKGLIDNTIKVPFKIHHLYNSDYQLIFEGLIERCSESRVENAYDLTKRMAHVDFDYKDYPLELIPDLSRLEDKNLPSEPFIVLQWRASTKIRSLSEKVTAQIINIILNKGFKVVMMDRPDHSHLTTNMIEKNNLPKTSAINIENSKDITHTVAIISQAEGVVGVDSAMLHIGEALNKPILGLFGPFDPKTRLSYYRNRNWLKPHEYDCPYPLCGFHLEAKQYCIGYINKDLHCLSKLDMEEFGMKFDLLFGDTKNA